MLSGIGPSSLVDYLLWDDVIVDLMQPAKAGVMLLAGWTGYNKHYFIGVSVLLVTLLCIYVFTQFVYVSKLICMAINRLKLN